MCPSPRFFCTLNKKNFLTQLYSASQRFSVNFCIKPVCARLEFKFSEVTLFFLEQSALFGINFCFLHLCGRYHQCIFVEAYC